jgi:hypothetical protein
LDVALFVSWHKAWPSELAEAGAQRGEVDAAVEGAGVGSTGGLGVGAGAAVGKPGAKLRVLLLTLRLCRGGRPDVPVSAGGG